MGLLQRALPGVPHRREDESCEGLPLAVYPGGIYRALHDGLRCVDDRGYLQWVDGAAKFGGIDCVERGDCERDEGVF